MMAWSSVSDFLDMGGYALYVWSSYLVTLGTLAWELVLLSQRRHLALDDVLQDRLNDGGRSAV